MSNETKSGKKIGVVTAIYLTAEMHFSIAVQTVLSLYGSKSSHSLFPVAVLNECSTSASHVAWFKNTFDCFIVNERNNVARAWNRGIKECLEAGCDYVLLMNLDLVFHSQFLNNLITFAEARKEALVWCGDPWPEQGTLEQAVLTGETFNEFDSSCFLLDRRLIDTVGYFDEQFEPAYHEDKDMLYRIKLAGGKALATPTARYFHIGQVTLKGSIAEKHEEFLQSTRHMMNESMLRYEKKWGGLPGNEKFTEPYDGKGGKAGNAA